MAAMYDENTETAVVSQLLNFPHVWDSVSDKLASELFTNDLCRKVFVTLKHLNEHGDEADTVGVIRALADVVDPLEIHQIAEYHSYSVSSLPRNIKALEDMCMARKLHKATYRIAELAQDSEQGTIAERLEKAKACLDDLEFEQEAVDYKDAYTIAMEHQGVLDARDQKTATVYGTGFFELDELLGGGLEPGKLMVIGARPSVGKSAIALNIALSMATLHPTAFMSMEMPYADVADRQFAILGGAKMQHLRQPSKGLEWDRVVDAAERSKAIKFFVTDRTAVNINGVRSFARRMKRKHGLQVLVIDYIGLMRGTNPKLDKRFQIEEITQGLKTLAKELGIAVVALAQLNRDADANALDVPGLKNLADSASIERDADVIAFLHRPIVVNPDLGEKFTHFAVLRVAKNRQGVCGDVNFYYRGEVMGFESWGGESPISEERSRAKKHRGMM